MSHFFHVVAVSNELMNTLVDKHLFGRQNMRVIRNGIPLPEIAVKRPMVNQFIIGSAGRFFPVKDYQLLIEIARILKNEQTVKFKLAGDGPQHQTLIALINRHQLHGSFEIIGHVEDTGTFYKSLSMYINTSRHEGIPMTILEAMSHGLPIVAPKIGGIPEIVQNHCEGFIVESRDPEAFVEKCEYLRLNKQVYEKCVIAARRRVELELSEEHMGREYLDAYSQILQ